MTGLYKCCIFVNSYIHQIRIITFRLKAYKVLTFLHITAKYFNSKRWARAETKTKIIEV